MAAPTFESLARRWRLLIDGSSPVYKFDAYAPAM
jgi:hypothetical protein